MGERKWEERDGQLHIFLARCSKLTPLIIEYSRTTSVYLSHAHMLQTARTASLTKSLHMSPTKSTEVINVYRSSTEK